MKTVEFTCMADGTAAEYAFLATQEKLFVDDLPKRLLVALEALEDSFSGYRVSRLQHSLQSATRAYHAGESEQMVVAALLHDIGDPLWHPFCDPMFVSAYIGWSNTTGCFKHITTPTISATTAMPAINTKITAGIRTR